MTTETTTQQVHQCDCGWVGTITDMVHRCEFDEHRECDQHECPQCLQVLVNHLNPIASFPTIDLCVNFLCSIGCKWDYKKEQQLNAKSCFKFKDTLVFYDPYELLKF